MALSTSELNTLTQEFIAPGVTDNVFKNDPLLAYLKANQPRRFAGGTNIREVLMYNKEVGAAYDHTDISSPFSEAITRLSEHVTYDIKFYYAKVAVNKAIVQVLNKGPEAAFRLIDIHMVNGALKLSEMLALDLYNYGQDASGSGTGFDSDGTDRTLMLNGLAEIVNDDTTDSWEGLTDTDGQQFQVIGTSSFTRGSAGDVSGAMDGNVTNVNGAITYKILDEKYMEAVIGTEQPNLGVTTNLGYSYIKQKFQPLQRITSLDPNVGFTGLEFNASRIMVSQYAPGTVSSGENVSSEGEVLWFLNTPHLRLWITDDAEYAFGFSGFKGKRDDDLLAGQIKFAGNITCVAPRLQAQLNQITG